MLSHQLVLQQNQILIEHVISKLMGYQMLQQRQHQQLGYSVVKKHLNQVLKAQSKLQIVQLRLNVQTKLESCLHIVQIALASFNNSLIFVK